MQKDLFYGDPKRIEETRGNFVKGNLALSRRWYLAHKAEPGAIVHVMKGLPPSARRLLEGAIMPFSWQSFGALIDVDEAIAEHVMKGRVAAMKSFGYELGNHDLNGVYRAFLSVTSPQFALAKVTLLGSMYFKDSTLGFQPIGPGQGQVRLVGRSMPRYMCEHGISGWLEAVIEAAKASKHTVTHEQCVHRGDAECRWKCAWVTASVERENARNAADRERENSTTDA
jgi:hypothetical protein